MLTIKNSGLVSHVCIKRCAGDHSQVAVIFSHRVHHWALAGVIIEVVVPSHDAVERIHVGGLGPAVPTEQHLKGKWSRSWTISIHWRIPQNCNTTGFGKLNTQTVLVSDQLTYWTSLGKRTYRSVCVRTKRRITDKSMETVLQVTIHKTPYNLFLYTETSTNFTHNQLHLM